MLIRSPESEIAGAPFRDKRMNMWVPFQISPKRMKNTDKAGSKIFGFIEFEKHAKDNISDSMEKALKKGVVFAEEDTKFFRNRKNTVSVNTRNEFAGHTKSPFLIIHVAAGRAETALAGKRNRFKFTTVRTAIESVTIRRIMAMDHAFDIIHNIFARTKNVLDVFIVVRKNGLEDVLFIHKDILQ